MFRAKRKENNIKKKIKNNTGKEQNICGPTVLRIKIKNCSQKKERKIDIAKKKKKKKKKKRVLIDLYHRNHDSR